MYYHHVVCHGCNQSKATAYIYAAESGKKIEVVWCWWCDGQ